MYEERSRLGDWIRQAATQLGGESARLEAEVLAGHVLGLSRARLYASMRDSLSEVELARLGELLARRREGWPVAYLTGVREFWSLPLYVSTDVLIPRPDTETLVEAALAALAGRQAPRVLDLGCGSGAIALAIRQVRRDAAVVAVDVSAAALAVAADNAERLGLPLDLRRGSWFDALRPAERFELIVANPPYLAETDPHLLEGDLRFEPRGALVAAQDGLADLAAIIRGAPEHLQPGGVLWLEHGAAQGEAVRQRLSGRGFRAVLSRNDLEGRERISGGTWI
ncbi:MAG: peptide chain release factor N(5)-glutamine methyltransferase [Xanthomonadales bacterium]|jgi:release factor glutamine methyltransferase|nr:peptide chain release factor N(5)-glutamine methyltransferase [Xanthomonadales bacterium]